MDLKVATDNIKWLLAKIKEQEMLKALLRSQSETDIAVRRVNMTPALAKQLLDTNKDNRRIRDRRVEQYTRTMEIGLWRENGDTIKIGRSGRLLDGQHRLLAVVKSGVTMPMLIADGIADEAFITLDVGANRDTEDMFYLNGETHSTSMLACATRWLYRYGHGVSSRQAGLATSFELQELLQVHPGLRDSIKLVSAHPRVVSRGMLAFMHYVCKLSASQARADEFVNGVVYGSNLPAEHPIMLLRNRLVFSAGTRGRKQLHELTRVALIIKTWNAFTVGRSIGTLKWSVDEHFPEIINFPPNAVAGITRKE